MTKDVLVTVRGLQMTPDGDDTIEVTTTGKYYEKDGKRYLFYDEIGDDTNLIVKNSIQITEEHVSVSKKGLINAQMNFEKENKLVYMRRLMDRWRWVCIRRASVLMNAMIF